MQIGLYKAPEIRLTVLINEILIKVHNVVKMRAIRSRDLSKLLGYKYGTEPSLFKKIKSMLLYGIIEGRGIYNVTKLGESILYPESDEEKEKMMKNAILNGAYWRILFEKNKKQLPQKGLWIQLKNITEVDHATARKYERRIRMWYTEDMTLIKDDNLDIEEVSFNNVSVSKIMSPKKNVSAFGQLIIPSIGTIEINDKDTLSIAYSCLKVLEKKIKQKAPDQNILNI